MQIDKLLVAGSSGMLVLKLLSEADMYGYQITSELAKRSDDTFLFKAGTLYPLLHSLEEKGLVESYDMAAESGKTRRYYRLTERGRGGLAEKSAEWKRYSAAVDGVMKGGTVGV